MNHVKVTGTGHFTPKTCITNDDLSKIVDTSDKWISTRTGIKSRYISDGITTSKMGYLASLQAMDLAGIQPKDIDLIIVATMTPDNYLPNSACEIQKEIGAINAVCFDINAACTGFIYALHTATQYIMTGMYKTALVVGSDVTSKIVDWKDRSTCVLFGDGAGATVIQKSEHPGIKNMSMGSDGSMSDVLKCQSRSIHNLLNQSNINTLDYMTMSGQEVYKFVCSTIPNNIQNMIEESDKSIEDIDLFIFHQANKRIIESVAKRLNVDKEKFYINLQKYGNTSSASIPIALDEVIRKQLVGKGDLIVLSGFGGGLTWGSTLIEL